MNFQKLLTYSLILIISTITLEARDNPFVPTQSYIDKKAEMVDENYSYDVPRNISMMESSSVSTEYMDSDIMLTNGKHNLLSFVIVEVSDETLSITTQNQLLKKFDLNYKGTKKLVFDFKSSKGFYSKRAELSSYNFKFLSIGAHPRDGFYRIVVSVDDIPSNYDVMYENDTIHIMKSQM